MKIIHMANHALEIGNGIVNVMVDLACTQADEGHSVIVATAGGEFEGLLAAHGVKHVRIEQQPKPHKLLVMCWKFNRLVMQEKPDVVHVHMMTGMLIAKAMRFGRSYRLVSTVHNVHQRTAKLMGLADTVVAVSKSVQRTMVKRGLKPWQMRTVENGTLETPRRKPDTVRPAVAELLHPNVVTIAGMFRRKGIAVLMDAFSRVDRDTGAHLYIVGDGPDRAEFEQLMFKYAMCDRVHFLGFQPDAEAFLKQTDIFALASFADSGPLVITEAREAGCAIVASNVDGIPQLLDYGMAGMLVPPGNVTELADGINALLEKPALRAEWAKRARANLDRFSVKRVSREYLSVYEQVTGHAPASAAPMQTVDMPISMSETA